MRMQQYKVEIEKKKLNEHFRSENQKCKMQMDYRFLFSYSIVHVRYSIWFASELFRLWII